MRIISDGIPRSPGSKLGTGMESVQGRRNWDEVYYVVSVGVWGIKRVTHALVF